jgi:hypothetical protein
MNSFSRSSIWSQRRTVVPTVLQSFGSPLLVGTTLLTPHEGSLKIADSHYLLLCAPSLTKQARQVHVLTKCDYTMKEEKINQRFKIKMRNEEENNMVYLLCF